MNVLLSASEASPPINVLLSACEASPVINVLLSASEASPVTTTKKERHEEGEDGPSSVGVLEQERIGDDDHSTAIG